jgi:hypothetical protein
MEPIRRSAGIGLLLYVVALIAAFVNSGPGGDYEPAGVRAFMSSGHRPVAFAMFYVGAFAAIGLLVFAFGARDRLRQHGEIFWALGIIATACSIAGWVLSSGLAVAFAEGGQSVRAGVPGPVLYTLSEVANLMLACAPAFCLGVMGLMLAWRGALPTWLKVFTVAGGVCGMLAAFYFPLPIYLIWLVALGIWVARSPQPRALAVPLQESLV